MRERERKRQQKLKRESRREDSEEAKIIEREKKQVIKS